MALMAHQIEAWRRFRASPYGAIFFSPGCGKTATALKIAQSKFEAGEIDTLLVIAPKGVDEQWVRDEAPKWLDCPYTPVSVEAYLSLLEVPSRRRKDSLYILVTNIDKFSHARFVAMYYKAVSPRTMVVVDEATRIKNIKASRTKALIRLPEVQSRFILTGTPITNSAIDVWAMVAFLSPAVLSRGRLVYATLLGDTYMSFRAKYCMLMKVNVSGSARSTMVPLSEKVFKVVKRLDFATASMRFGLSWEDWQYIQGMEKWESPYKNIKELQRVLAPFSMFVDIRQCMDMPEQNYVVRTVDMTKEAEARYREVVDTAPNKAAMLVKLQEVTGGFLNRAPYTDDWREEGASGGIETFPSNKIEALLADLEALADEQAVVSCRFQWEVDNLVSILGRERVCLFTGSFKDDVALFTSGERQFFVANEHCLIGLNLQCAHYMFFLTSNFSLEDRQQAEGRIWRAGQGFPCTYYDYVTPGTIDEYVLNSLKAKKDIQAAIVNNEDVASMVGFDYMKN